MKINRFALQAIRQAQGVTLTELASACELSLPHMSRIESGERAAQPVTIRRLASVLGVPVLALTERLDEEGS